MSKSDEKTPLQIPSTLVKNVKIQGKDTLGDKFKFDIIGSNGYVEIEPAVVKFSGFEVGKINITKVKIINTASKPQRVNILPPQTPYFSIKFDKKGQLVPGMSEDIFIHFTPAEHKYYFDTIRIHTETDQLQVPVHAYPVMNKDSNKDVFPKLIDFGTCPLGTTQTMRFPLVCKIPLNFEYEFTVKKEHNDIAINPLRGIVPGKSSTEIEILFTPSQAVTVVAEFELNISQFDFEPLKVKVVGSGNYKEAIEEHQKEGKSLTAKKMGKIDTIRISTADQIKFTSEKASESMTTFFGLRDVDKQKDSIVDDDSKNYKNLMSQKSKLKEEPILEEKKSHIDSTKLSGLQIYEDVAVSPPDRHSQEKSFLERFNQIQALDKEKNIKFFPSIGDPFFTPENEQEILVERENYKNHFLDEYERKGITRYSMEYNQDFPKVGEVYPTYGPTFDFLKNDDIRKRRGILNRFVNIVSKYILGERVKKRAKKVKVVLEGAKTREEVKKIVERDKQRAEYYGVGKKDFVQFTFEFNPNKVVDLRFPIQLETSAANLAYKFELNQRIGFDDFTPIDPLPTSDLEIMQYKPVPPPQIINYPPLETNRKDRRCAEEEYSLSGPCGPYEKPSDTRELIDPLPVNLTKPFNVESHIFVCPHPSLKNMTPYFPVVETDPEFELRPSKVPLPDVLDPTYDTDYNLLKREFLSSAAGMETERMIEPLPLEFTNYFTHKLTIGYDYGFEDRMEKNCPDIMDKAYDEDKYTDSDSDEENAEDPNMTGLDEWLDMIEKDDMKIKEYKKKHEIEISDEVESTMSTMNKQLENEKELWMATLVTKVNECNKNIVNKENLINLL